MGQAFLVDSSPKVVLLTVDLYEDFIDIEWIAVSLMSALQSAGISMAKLDAP